jgi:hypothetical protein
MMAEGVIGFRPAEINEMTGIIKQIIDGMPERDIISCHMAEERIPDRPWINDLSPVKRKRLVTHAFRRCGWSFWSNNRGRRNKVFLRPGR